MSMLEGEEGERADDDYAKGKIKICSNTMLATWRPLVAGGGAHLFSA